MITRREFVQASGVAVAGLGFALPSEAAMPADMPRELKPRGADLGSLFAEIERLTKNREYTYSFLGNRFQSLEEFKTTSREKLMELMQYRPAKVEPQPEVIERSDQGDFVREKILFSTAPQFRVPAYVLIPKNLKKPAPAIVDLHSHGGMFIFGKEKVVDLGTNHAVMTEYHLKNYDGRPTATTLVRRGYVVITIDAFMFGERRLMMDSDLNQGWDRTKYTTDQVQTLNQKCRSKEATLAKSMILAGLTWPGIVFWDDMRTVDYLTTRPEVDPQRIGCIGISMGGYRSFYLTALDERIRAAVVVGFMSTVQSMLPAHIDTHSWVHFLPGLHTWLDWPDVASLAAPRALLVQQCTQDQLFPLSGMRASVDLIAKAYEKAGFKNRFAGKFYDVPHRFTIAMQDDAFRWLDQQLKS